MAREDKDGSGVEMGFMGMSPVFLAKRFLRCKNSEGLAFSFLAKHCVG
jgi:hypothetical protein